jgi:hypothetical protein
MVLLFPIGLFDIVDRKRMGLVRQGIGKDIADRNDPSSMLVAAAEEILRPFPPKP